MSSLFPIRLTARREISPSVLHLCFVRDDGAPLEYTPGQFIQIHFPLADGSIARRSYSCATRHDHHIQVGEAVEFIASLVPGGAATALFQGMAIGDAVEASGPLGQFVLKPGDNNHRYLMVATGTGIASYRSMLPELEAQMNARGVQVALLHGIRSPEDALFADEFIAFAERHPQQFRYLACFSRQMPETGSALARHAFHGYVQNALPTLSPDTEHDVAYLCGNPNMVDACVETLKNLGLAMRHIRREKYISQASNAPAKA